MDYLIGYTFTKNWHDAILVVVMKFSKIVILIPYNKTTTSQQLAWLALI